MWSSSRLQLICCQGLGQGGRREPLLGVKPEEEEGSSKTTEVGEIPQGRGDGCFWLLSPPWTRCLVTQRRESVQTVLIRPENRNWNVRAPWSGVPNNSRTLPSPKLHLHFLEQGSPTHQTDLYLILSCVMLCWCKVVFLPLATLPLLFLSFFLLPPPPAQSLISFSSIHGDTTCL